jgi:hypothetical protein
MKKLITVDGIEGTKLREFFKFSPPTNYAVFRDPRIRHFRSRQIRILAFDDKKFKIIYSCKKTYNLLIKSCHLLIPRLPKERPSFRRSLQSSKENTSTSKH